LTSKQLDEVPDGGAVDVVLHAGEATDVEVRGVLLEPTEKSPFDTFNPTARELRVRRDEKTRIVMGEAAEIVPGGIFRVGGALKSREEIDASVIVLLTKVATIQ
jgi:hypothetical protein